jgi:transcription initiation factor TFIIIB Brf1 subunit/transcription initiation factor TFIIB
MQGASSVPSTARILSANMERLQAALSFLELPLHVAKAAKQLLALVIEANATAEPRRNTTAATVAATIYMAAREERHALPLGRVGAALSVYGIAVGKEYRFV